MSVSADIIPIVDQDQWQRQQAYTDETLAPLFQLLEQVKDPEIPALSIWDMGILRAIELQAEGNLSPDVLKQRTITVVITPTYSGCPAMDLIRDDITNVLNTAGYRDINIKTQLSPAWSSHWMSDDAKARMAKSGIAPPETGDEQLNPQCPVCGSRQTRVISQFGSTACKALYQCDDCSEPFDYFKPF